MLIVYGLTGCAGSIIRNPVPSALADQKAQVLNVEGGRFWGDDSPTNVTEVFRERLPNLGKDGFLVANVNGRAQVEILALSGGGPDGSFGAGILAGWTERGDRPEFEHVTGVSAGAITAPFAFLGPKYDPQLREIWTQYGTDELATPQVLAGIFGGDSLADTTPLRNLIAKYVDRNLLREVAAEYRRGRSLTIGTTNLDAKRPVVWNMGEIAVHDSDEAVELFRAVIRASAAIPGLFPPVNIKVKSGGKIYDEMHVDGGVTRQIYVSPVNLPFHAFDTLYKKPPYRKLYLIQNGKMSPDYKPVEQKTLDIASESINTLLVSQHRGNVYRIYRLAKDAKADFNTLSIPASFNYKSKEKFDLGYQTALFETGRQLGLKGDAWLKAPPDAAEDKIPPILKSAQR